MAETYYAAINWNEIEDIIDKSTWEKLTEQFLVGYTYSLIQ